MKAYGPWWAFLTIFVMNMICLRLFGAIEKTAAKENVRHALAAWLNAR
jgi:ABC-type polysaccharide/polyol phosphate export permease